jgi:hypothetical protein
MHHACGITDQISWDFSFWRKEISLKISRKLYAHTIRQFTIRQQKNRQLTITAMFSQMKSDNFKALQKRA